MDYRQVFVIICLMRYTSLTPLNINSITASNDETVANQVSPDCRSSSERICLTPDCVIAAGKLLDNMDQRVDPCDDFYQFACGKWLERNIIPDDSSGITLFTELRDALQVKLKQLLEEPYQGDEGMSVKKAKMLYMSCMNENAIEDRKLIPLRAFLDSLGGWPVLGSGSWNETDFNLENQLVKLWLHLNRVLIHHQVTPDKRNSDEYIILIDQPALGMPNREYFLKSRNDVMLKAYEDYAVELAVALGAERTSAQEEINNMINFEIQLANISIREEDLRDSLANYKKLTFQELKERFKGFDWARYMTSLYDHVNMTINDTTQVALQAEGYITKVLPLLNRTNKRTIATYLVWRILMYRMTSLPYIYREIHLKYQKALHGNRVEKPRWRICVQYANDQLGKAVGKLFVERYFNGAKEEAVDMINRILGAFKERLQSLDWMDERTKSAAREKADAIVKRIGYPSFILNNTELDSEYDKFEMFQPDKFFENVIEILKKKAIANLEKLGTSVDKNKWQANPAIVNAYYSPTNNQIIFPAGILQPPFYGYNAPKYLNYGAAGVVVGHEITHGFDDEGRQYDKDGNLVQWWSEAASTNFKERAKCMIDQYANYTVEEVNMNLNGILTQGENIADNGGLKQAFQAYRALVAEEGREEMAMPGLSMDNNQLFFLSFAQIWCSTSRPPGYVNMIRTGRHSPGRFRVIGTLSNSEEFATAFKCPLGSRMNPRSKCSIW